MIKKSWGHVHKNPKRANFALDRFQRSAEVHRKLSHRKPSSVSPIPVPPWFMPDLLKATTLHPWRLCWLARRDGTLVCTAVQMDSPSGSSGRYNITIGNSQSHSFSDTLPSEHSLVKAEDPGLIIRVDPLHKIRVSLKQKFIFSIRSF